MKSRPWIAAVAALYFLFAFLVSGEDLPHPVPRIDFAMPSEVDAPVDPDANEIAVFDDYSWRAFIALNWPAKTGIRGVPDELKKIGDFSGRALRSFGGHGKPITIYSRAMVRRPRHGPRLMVSLLRARCRLQDPGAPEFWVPSPIFGISTRRLMGVLEVR